MDDATARVSPFRPALALVLCVALALLRAAAATAAEPAPLRVGTSGDYAPFSQGDAPPQGFDIDVATGLARDLGRRLEFVKFQWPDLIAALQQNRLDLAASGVTVRADRALVGRFTRPYATSSALALIRRSDTPRFPDLTALDRDGVRIAVNRGGHLEKLAHERFARAAIQPMSDNTALLQPLQAGAADAVITDTLEAPHLLADNPPLAALAPFSRDFKALLVRGDDPALFAAVDQWLAAREADGWLNETRRRWLGGAAEVTPATARIEAIASLLEQRCGLMPWVGAAKREAGLPIEDRAREGVVLDGAKRRAATAGLDADAVAAVFAVLIDAAKVIQRATPTAERVASLDALRAVLNDLDDRLLTELAAARALTSGAEWRGLLEENLRSLDIVDDEIKTRLARALAGVLGNRAP